MGKHTRKQRKNGMLKKIGDELKFKKDVGSDLLKQSMRWTQTLTIEEYLLNVKLESAITQTAILLLFALHFDIFMPFLGWFLGFILAINIYDLVKFLIKLKLLKKS